MSRIKIIPDSRDPSVPRHMPGAKDLSSEMPRYRNTGKPPLPLDKSYSPQGGK